MARVASGPSSSGLRHLLVRLHPVQQLIEQVLGREIDLVSHGGLKATLDDDIRREAVLL